MSPKITSLIPSDLARSSTASVCFSYSSFVPSVNLTFKSGMPIDSAWTSSSSSLTPCIEILLNRSLTVVSRYFTSNSFSVRTLCRQYEESFPPLQQNIAFGLFINVIGQFYRIVQCRSRKRWLNHLRMDVEDESDGFTGSDTFLFADGGFER